MNTLAELKRHLATPNATLQMTAYELLNGDEWVSHPVRNPNPRTVAKYQTNSVKLEGGSWLYFNKASEWQFDGDKAIQTSTGIRLTYTIA